MQDEASAFGAGHIDFLASHVPRDKNAVFCCNFRYGVDLDILNKGQGLSESQFMTRHLPAGTFAVSLRRQPSNT